jgi:wyosine [tRNA(Phe)-imidazoG37] synthetase (radical SAM superfamily)
MQMEVERRPFYRPEEILKEVKEKLETVAKMRKVVDYITFVPDGEPTLDVNLGEEIDMLKPLGIRIAVISNASLIWDEGVRKELSKADWVSLKVDAVDELAWRRINRPHRALKLESILEGILDFSRSYRGVLATETMLVRDANDGERSLEMIADFLAQVRPAKAYISVPTRPPAENWVMPPSEESINRAYQIFSRKLDHVELLLGYEGDIFDFTGDVERDLLSITAVHPMRKEAVDKFLQQAGKSWGFIQRLIDAGQLVETEYGGNRFYLRRPDFYPFDGREPV